MSKLTLQKFANLEIGDSIHDMHYGLHALELESPLKVSNHVSMPAPAGCLFITGATERMYCNKEAVVVKVRIGTHGQVVTLAYSYDDRTFGMFEISEGSANRGD